MTDTEGRPLVSARRFDVLRHKAVWAVYKIPASQSSISRTSDFGYLNPHQVNSR